MMISALTLPGLGYLIDAYGFRVGFGFLTVLAASGVLVAGLYAIRSKRIIRKV